MGLHAIAPIGILSPYCYWPHGPDKSGKSMPMGAAACSPTHWHSVPLLFWAMFHFSRGDKWHAVTHMAEISLTVLKAMCHFSNDTWPRKVGHKYANAWGCMQPRVWQTFASLFWAMWPRIVGETVCQCVELHAMPCVDILVSITCLGYVAQKSRGNVCQ